MNHEIFTEVITVEPRRQGSNRYWMYQVADKFGHIYAVLTTLAGNITDVIWLGQDMSRRYNAPTSFNVY